MQDLLARQAALWQPMYDKVLSYHRRRHEIASAMRDAFTNVAEAGYEANKRKVQDVIDSATNSAPAGSEAAVVALQSAVSATTTLYETMQQTAKHAIEVAESNWENAAVVTSNAARNASEQAPRVAKR